MNLKEEKRKIDKKLSEEQCSVCWAGILMWFLIAALAASLLLSSCKQIEYVPVEKVKKEYVTKTDTFIQKDSVHIKDSVFVTTKGDTVYVNKWHVSYKDRWRDRIKTDTLIRVDSINTPYPVPAQLTKWERTKMVAGEMAIWVCIGAALVCLVGLFIRRK